MPAEKSHKCRKRKIVETYVKQEIDEVSESDSKESSSSNENSDDDSYQEDEGDEEDIFENEIDIANGNDNNFKDSSDEAENIPRKKRKTTKTTNKKIANSKPSSEKNFEPIINFEDRKTLQSSEYEIQMFTKNGDPRQRLLVFASEDKKLCYVYFKDTYQDRYICSRCKKKQKSVYASLRQIPKSEDYIELGQNEHVCEPVEYSQPPEDKAEKFLDPSEYEIALNQQATLKPIIFYGKSKKLCYEFFPNQHHIYLCNGCFEVKKSGLAAINVRKDADGNFLVSHRNPKHICKPRKYIPGKYVNRTLMGERIQFVTGRKKKSELELVTFMDENDTNFCYIYFYDQKTKIFFCQTCKNLGRQVSAKIHVNRFGEEYAHIFKCEHNNCKLLAYSELGINESQILHRSGLHPKQVKEREIPEERILKLPNFELQRNRAGEANMTLIVFDPNNDQKELCYKYYFDKYTKHYICNNCREKHKTKVSAKLCQDSKTGENYLKLGKFEHLCKPHIFEYEIPLVKAPNFLIQNRNSKNQKLIILTEADKNLCYNYFLNKGKMNCRECHKKNKTVSAAFCKDINGEECIQLGKIQHVCKPVKFE